MRTILLIAAAAIASPTISQAQDRQPAKADHDIVVTGRRLSDTEAALKACVRQHCPPDQDIAATLAHAENQFVAGQYKGARSTLLASIDRNRHVGKQYPVELGDLYRANARVAVNMGEVRDFQTSELASLDALRAGLPRDDARVLAQRIEVADLFARVNRSDSALYAYRDIAQDARRTGNKSMQGYALLRHAMLLFILAEADKNTYAVDAKAAINALANESDPALASFASAASLLSARMAAKTGDNAAIDAIIAKFPRPTTRPLLIYAPAIIEQDSGRAVSSGSMTAKMAVGPTEDQWIDVTFWISPTGQVSDLETLRESPALDHSWVKPVLAAIAKRRYAPLAMDKLSPGVVRVERYTRTADWIDQTGTRLRQREALPRIEMVDLTLDAPANAGSAKPTAQPASPVG